MQACRPRPILDRALLYASKKMSAMKDQHTFRKTWSTLYFLNKGYLIVISASTLCVEKYTKDEKEP